MQTIKLNNGWQFQDLTNDTSAIVNLPHDATIGTEREKEGRTYFLNVGFKGIRCSYTKALYIPEEHRGKALYLEFEGIYRDFIVTVNGHKILDESFGYIPYEARIDEFVNYGADNELKIEINTPEQFHNRWYAGSGIYQDVFLHVAEPDHIAFHGVKITTLSHDPAKIRVETEVVGTGTVQIDILDGNDVIAAASGTCTEIEIPDAKLWDAENPNLYTARVTLHKDGTICDVSNHAFGIRTLEWNAEQGFLVNGVRTLLKGGCIHNDNGVIGMVTNRITEERRVKNLKASGFNALRSAHHPMSPALLEMCDKYGMYVMDESFDVWYRMKQMSGFHVRFMEYYEDVTARMVKKDYNHPCVIMYSIGNEINELGSLKGVRIGSRMIDIVHSIDSTRPVVLCPSMKMSRQFLVDMPYATMDEDEFMAQGQEYVQKDFMHYIWLYTQAISNIPGTEDDPYPQDIRQADEACTEPLYSQLTVAGYNYYSANFDALHEIHPDRVLVGTETRGHLIYDNWKYIQEHPFAIGDFIWTLQDHIGEANVGGRNYSGAAAEGDSAATSQGRDYPWLLNDGGVIDLIGHTLPAIHKFRLCWGEEHGIFLASQPPIHNGIAASYGCYKWTDTIDSWSYDGYDGNPTFVDVYSDADEVEVFLNGLSIGRQKPTEYFAKFPCVYAPGELVGVGYNAEGAEICRTVLRSANTETKISVTPDKTVLKADAQDFVFLNIDITDSNGTVKALPERELTITVDGPATLQGFGSAEPVTAESFCDNVHTTCNGRTLAVIRSSNAPGTIAVTVQAKGLKDTVIHLDSEQ